MVVVGVVVLAVALAVGAVGCSLGGDGEPESDETVTATAPGETETEVSEEPPAESMEARQVYLDAGCATCHGTDGEGTGVGPALGGHTAQQVRQQVRSPLAQMPSYSREQLSDEELAAIVAYIAGLEAAEEHVEPLAISDVVAAHHWMALSALAAGDGQDALHHIGHIVDAVDDPEHRDALLQARELVRAGDLHEAEHLIQEMLAGKAQPGLGIARLHLRLALTAVDQRDTGEAIHQLRHFLEVAEAAERRQGRAALEQLRGGELHEAEHAIADLLGVERE
ncbi:MAG TPA: cytochrome c [Gaiellaceae bacterium]|nr:cytochrome c [Gaiellaceae bacterium]